MVALLFVQCSKKQAEIVQSTVRPKEEFRSKAPSPTAARNIELGKYTTMDLSNGLKVIVVENHKLPVVSYQLSLLNTPIMEKDQAGYVSMAGDLLSKGTSNMTKAQIDESIDYIGASLSSSSGGLFGSSLRKHSGKLLDVMTDVLYNPSFPKEEFDKSRKQTLSGLSTSKTNPNAISANIASIVMYGKDHPFGEVTTEKTVNNITIDKCKEYYKTYFVPNNAYLIIVGDITPEEAKKQAEERFGKWKKGVVPTSTYPAPPSISERKVIVGNKDGAVQSVIRITYPIDFKPGQADILEASVMNSVLGGGVFSGRLMQNLRESKAYTYGASSSLSANEIVGSFSASASVRTAVTDSSVQEFIYEMERMATDPPKPEDLLLVKNSLAGSFARSLESPQTIANFARTIFKYNLPLNYFDTYLSRLEKVTIDDINKAVKTYIKPDKAYIIVVGNKDAISENLLRFDSDGEIDYYDAFGEKLKMDANIIPDNVNGKTVIEDYIKTIGGAKKLQSIKSLETTANMELMGQKVSAVTKQNLPDQLAMEMNMGGNIVMQQVVNGNKGLVAQMGQKQVIDSTNPMFAEMKDGVTIFKQLDYLDGKYKLELKGLDNVGSEKCYKLLVTGPDGKMSTEFYSMKTNLLMRTITEQDQGPNKVSIINTFGDYKAIDGVMFPHMTSIEGVMPMTLEQKVTEIKVNPVFDAAAFKID